MLLSYQVDLIIGFSFLISLAAGYFFVPAKLKTEFSYKKLRKSQISKLLPYASLAAFIFALMNFQTKLSNLLGLDLSQNYNQYLLRLEGNKVSYFQNLETPLLTYFCAGIYLLGFSFLLIFTFVIFLCNSNKETLKEYAAAFTCIYLAAYPFYIFFPVEVTGHVLPEMSPLLYQLNPFIVQLVTICDPGLNNCFPSLHAALSVMATLFIILKTELKSYKVFALLITLSIQFAILYLGIHWITDLLAGNLLAFIVYFLVTRSSGLKNKKEGKIRHLRYKNEDFDIYLR